MVEQLLVVVEVAVLAVVLVVTAVKQEVVAAPAHNLMDLDMETTLEFLMLAPAAG
jgi:hypothetical protein